MDLNPYESPKTEHPKSQWQRAKRAAGLAAILLLTPPALVTAIFTVCTLERPLGWHSPFFLFGVPFSLLTALMVAAAIVWRPRKDEPNSSYSRIGLLLLTPICVALATVIGFMLAVLTYMALARVDQIPGAEWAIYIAFFLPPSAALLLMLLLSWRLR